MTDRARVIMRRVAFDTDVLVHYLRGSEAALGFIAAIPWSGRLLPLPVYLELLQGCRDRSESKAVARFVERNFAAILPLTPAASAMALRLMKRHALPDGLRAMDALVAACALAGGADLATGNVRHYRSIRRLRLVPFSPRDG